MIKYCYQHRLASTLLYLLLIITGTWSASKLNMQLIPPLELPIVNIQSTWPGHDAKEVEQTLALPISQELMKNSAVKTIKAHSYNHLATWQVDLKEHYSSKEYASTFSRILHSLTLPKEINLSIKAFERKEVITRLLILPHNIDQLIPLTKDIQNDLRKQQLDSNETLLNAHQIWELTLTSQQLIDTGMSFTQMATHLRPLFNKGRLGKIGSNEQSLELQYPSPTLTEQYIKQLPIPLNKKLFKLDHLFKVNRFFDDSGIFIEYQNRPASEITIQRPENGDTLVYAKRFNQWLDKAKSTYQNKAELIKFGDQWIYLSGRLHTLLKNGLGGLIIVLGLLSLFLGNRCAFWVAMGIPAAFIGSLFILILVGGTLNMVSLFAFIISLGIVVDDAIVVAERYDQHKHNGSKTPALAAAKEMFPPVLTSSLTTTAAFLPLLFVGGVAGIFLREIPIIVLCVIFTSLIECFLILPGHLSYHSSTKIHPYRKKFLGYIHHYQNVTHPNLVKVLLTNRTHTLLTSVAFLMVSFSLLTFHYIPFNFFPSIEGEQIYANITFNEATSLQQKKATLNDLNKALSSINQSLPDKPVLSSVAYYGRHQMARNSLDQDRYASLRIELTEPSYRSISNANLLRKWAHAYIKNPTVSEINFFEPKSGPTSEVVTLNLFNNNLNTLSNALDDISHELSSIPIVNSVTSSKGNNHTALNITLLPETLALGLSSESINQQTQAALDGKIIYEENSPSLHQVVRLRLDQHERNLPTTWNHFPIIHEQQIIPLGSLANISAHDKNESILTIDGRRAQTLSINLDPSKGDVNQFIKTTLPKLSKKIESKYNTEVNVAGQYTAQTETLRDIALGALFAIIMIFIILAWLTQSYQLSLSIMLLIPYGIAGGLWGHIILGYPLSLLSFFGFFALTGILINDGIILVRHYQTLLKDHPKQKAMTLASSQRFKAVLLTSLTTIGGLTPLLFETSRQAQVLIPMAITIVFGLIFSTVWVLFILPTLIIKECQ
jgi:multidrug efflux pump subunit AcrB